MSRTARAVAVVACLLVCALLAPAGAPAFETSFLSSLKNVKTVGETKPANGDLNPYGIVVVPVTAGLLHAGNILISNFNNGGEPPTGNLQGRGTTIVELTPSGRLKLFAEINPKALPGECPGGVGLTTALAVLPQGYVVVGSLPTTNGQAESAKEGCLIVLNAMGHPVETISGPPINGPWDLTSVSEGQNTVLFVTNVLNGTVAHGETPTPEGTVVRIRLHVAPGYAPPKVTSEEVIADEFPERTDKAALVVGPTGDALGADGTLYVADTQQSRVAAVPNALTRHTPLHGGGLTVAKAGYLNGPLGMTLAPNGDLLTANAGDGNLVETTPTGAEFQPFDTGAGAGGLFGLTIAPNLRGVYFVNDGVNTLQLLH
jgi:hypothetical protein